MDVPPFPEPSWGGRDDGAGDFGIESPTPHLMVIHPNDGYRASLTTYLQSQGFCVCAFDEPQAAVEHIVSGDRVDTILIDADLPRTPGISLLARLQSLGVRVPIALMAVACDEAHEETALEYGAADFLSKSRSLSIMAKRLRLLAEGVKNQPSFERLSAKTVTVGRLDLKLRSHRALWKGRQVPLTVTEFKIVRLLAFRAGEEVSYREIYDVVHGTGFLAGDGPYGYRSNVRSLIRKIRNRFRAIDEAFAEIENYPGFGYRWRPQPHDVIDAGPSQNDHTGLCLDCRTAVAEQRAMPATGAPSR